MKIVFEDTDLEELITTGLNSKFEGGIRITVLSLDNTHYGNKK